MHILPTCMSGHHVHMWQLRRSKEGLAFSGTRVVSVCEPLCGCWDLTLSHLQEQQVLLTSKPSLQPLYENLSVLGKS